MGFPNFLHGKSSTEIDRFAKDVIQLSVTDDLKAVKDELREYRRSKKSLKEILTSLNTYYKGGGLVLVLGAGVSVSRGLPDWNTLLQKLILSNITSQTERRSRLKRSALMAKVIANIFSPNPLISARYLALYYRNNNSDDPLAFTKAVRDAIYDEMDAGGENDLIEEIKKLCIPLTGSRIWNVLFHIIMMICWKYP